MLVTWLTFSPTLAVVSSITHVIHTSLLLVCALFPSFACCHGGQLPGGVDPLKAQASVYGDVLEACLSEESFDGFTLWGFTDLHSWWV